MTHQLKRTKNSCRQVIMLHFVGLPAMISVLRTVLLIKAHFLLTVMKAILRPLTTVLDTVIRIITTILAFVVLVLVVFVVMAQFPALTPTVLLMLPVLPTTAMSLLTVVSPISNLRQPRRIHTVLPTLRGNIIRLLKLL